MVKEIKKINNHLDNLRSWLPDANVLKELENTCFYELAMLHLFQPNFRHSYPLLQAIISCYDAKLRLFKFGGQNVLFGLEDVVYMTGLNVDGEAVSGWDGEYKDICQTYLGIDGKVGKTGCVSLSWLRESFKIVPASALNDPNKLLHYVRAYVLFIIGCVVCPDQSGKFVSISFLRLLNTKEDFNRYAWGAALLAHLHRSLDHFLSPRNKGNLAGHSYSLMLFAIERVPRLGLYLMGNKKEPDENAITTFKEGRPGEFPLLKGWAEKLHHATHNNHDGKDANTFAMILATVRPDEIEWRPYQRLKADFLPGHLMGTEVMGLSQTILLCFSSAAHHLPNKCFKQFGLTKAPRTTQKPLIIKMKQRAGQHRDWKSWKKFAKYNAMWNERRQHLICQNMPPNELHDNDLDHNIHSDGSPSSHPVDDQRVAPNDDHSPPLTCSPTDPTPLSTGMPPSPPRATKKRKVYQRAPNRYDLRSNIKTPQALESAINVRNVHSMREEGIQNDRQLLGCPQH